MLEMMHLHHIQSQGCVSAKHNFNKLKLCLAETQLNLTLIY